MSGLVRSDKSVLNWNTRVLRTGSGQNGFDHGSEPLSLPLQSAKAWEFGELWREKCRHAPLTLVNQDCLSGVLHLTGQCIEGLDTLGGYIMFCSKKCKCRFPFVPSGWLKGSRSGQFDCMHSWSSGMLAFF